MTGDYVIPDIDYRSYGVTYNGEDDNLMNRNYFRFTIQRVPNFERFVRSVLMPPIRFGELIQPTTLSTDLRIPGGSYEFSPLQIGFNVDERFLSYLEIYKWFTSIGMYKEASTIDRKAYTSDATLIVTNSAYQPKYKVVFKGLYPVAIGELDFTSAEPISSPLQSSVTFNFSYIEIYNASGDFCYGTVGYNT